MEWEQSLRTDYRVDPLLPPEWSVSVPPGRHFSTLEGAPVEQWRSQPEVTPNELLRQLIRLTQGTHQGCSCQSQESYFIHSQRIKEAIHDYEAEQGHQYRKWVPVHLHGELAGTNLATVVHLQQSLRVAQGGQQSAQDHVFDADVHQRHAEGDIAKLKRKLFEAE